jgi:hypothetical protein
MLTKLLAGAAGAAALATAVPAAAQYPYGYNPSGYNNGYNSYGYNSYGYNSYSPYGAYGMNTQAAAQQCTAAVQNRLYTRTGLSSIITSLFGLSGTSARVLSVTRVTPNNGYVRVRGLATSGRATYNPYGSGYYGALGAGYAADLSFKCDVDYRGYVRDIDITRR